MYLGPAPFPPPAPGDTDVARFHADGALHLVLFLDADGVDVETQAEGLPTGAPFAVRALGPRPPHIIEAAPVDLANRAVLEARAARGDPPMPKPAPLAEAPPRRRPKPAFPPSRRAWR